MRWGHPRGGVSIGDEIALSSRHEHPCPPVAIAGADRALRRDRRRAPRHHRPARAGGVSRRGPRALSRPHAAGAAPRLGRRSRGDPQARQRDRDRGRAAGRQHRPCRRPDPVRRRGGAGAHPPRPHPRGRRDLEHHDLRSGRRARQGAGGGRRRGPPVSALARRRGQLHHRRQSLDQCRRHRCGGVWRRPRPRDGRRGGARRRPGDAPPQQAQEGQHRLRPQEPVHRRRRHARHHHRRGAQALSGAEERRDRLRRGAHRRTPRSSSSRWRRSAPTAR